MWLLWSSASELTRVCPCLRQGVCGVHGGCIDRVESSASELSRLCLCLRQGVCGVHGGRVDRVDPHHQLVVVEPAVRLHPEHHVLPGAAHLRRLPAGRLLAQDQRTGEPQASRTNEQMSRRLSVSSTSMSMCVQTNIKGDTSPS